MHPLRTLTLSAALTCTLIAPAAAWGPEGHSIVAEIAQRRLTPEGAGMVATLLGRGHSLASIASWPDDMRDERPETANWHFVDIPISVRAYKQDRDCSPDKKKGDCIILELGRVKDDLACGSGDKKVEALKFAVHFLGDIHQPLHTVDESLGGNGVKVELFMRGETCTGTCEPKRIASNFHSAWDEGLIKAMVWDWGHYVDRLESGWLKGAEAHNPGIDGGTPEQWANETHGFAPTVWNLRPADNTLDDRYLRDVLPILDRQLGVAGLRLAKFINDAATATATCTPH
jgi:nuclease S1